MGTKYAIGDRESSSKSFVVGKLTLGVEDGDYHSFLPSTVGIRAIITIEMNEKGIRWLLARVGGI
jgi:hypothetical protein